jgi:hypothetical protein
LIEYLYWEGCPSHERAQPLLRALMQELAIPEEELVVLEMKTDADAQLHRFIGSPTIRVDGVDVQDPGETAYGLECRIYHHRDGRISPLPDREGLKEALTGYADQRERS